MPGVRRGVTTFSNARRLRGMVPRYRKLEGIIGAALVDRDLLALLLRSPGDAADALDLSAEEREVLRSANARSLEELAAHVQARALEVSRAPGHGYPARILACGS